MAHQKIRLRHAEIKPLVMSRNATADLVFLLDVDNTLLDNDRVIADLRAHLGAAFGAAFGAASAARYWAAFETLRAELGYADDPDALQRCCIRQLISRPSTWPNCRALTTPRGAVDTSRRQTRRARRRRHHPRAAHRRR